jgi:hypothetical protein
MFKTNVIGIRILWLETFDPNFSDYYIRLLNSAKQALDSPDRIYYYQIMAGNHCEMWQSEPTAMDIQRAFHRLTPSNFKLTIFLSTVFR